VNRDIGGEHYKCDYPFEVETGNAGPAKELLKVASSGKGQEKEGSNSSPGRTSDPRRREKRRSKN